MNFSDESSIYDVPKPIFRFSSDFEDELPPPPPPVRQENIYCNYTNNNANKKGGGGGSVRLKTSKSAGNFAANGDTFQSLPPVRDTTSPLPPPPPPPAVVQPTSRDVSSPLPPPPPPPPAPPQPTSSSALPVKAKRAAVSAKNTLTRKNEDKQAQNKGSKSTLTRASLSFDDELNLKIR